MWIAAHAGAGLSNTRVVRFGHGGLGRCVGAQALPAYFDDTYSLSCSPRRGANGGIERWQVSG